MGDTPHLHQHHHNHHDCRRCSPSQEEGCSQEEGPGQKGPCQESSCQEGGKEARKEGCTKEEVNLFTSHRAPPLQAFLKAILFLNSTKYDVISFYMLLNRKIYAVKSKSFIFL